MIGLWQKLRRIENRLAKLGWVAVFLFAVPAIYADQRTLDDESIEEIDLLETNVKQVFGRVTPATVGIGSGSGVIVSKDGLVLTVAHVAPKVGSRLPVTFSDGRRAHAVVLGNHTNLDAAVCKLQGSGPYPFVPLGDSKDVSLGDWVIALGYPVTFDKGQPPAVRVGRVSRRHGDRALIADCPIMGGDSGGPLLNLAGEVIGIGSRCQDEMHINTFVPEQVYRTHWMSLVSGEDLTDLRRGRKPGRPSRPALDNVSSQLSELPEYPYAVDSVAHTATVFKPPLTNTRRLSRQTAIESLAEVQHAIKEMQVLIMADDQVISAGCRWRDASTVVTKLSLLPSGAANFICKLADESELDAALVGIDRDHDVAVLQLNVIEPANLDDWFAETVPDAGSLVVSSSTGGELVAGFVTSSPRHFSVNQPRIEPTQPFLGVKSHLLENRLAIVEVVQRSAAMKSGLLPGDEILTIDRRKVESPEELKMAIRGYSPGDRITVEVRRNNLPQEFPVLLGAMGGANERGAFDQWGGGPFSERRFGFPSVLTHDSAISPEDCGGPIFNARGKIVGVNISRALRVASYALTTEQVDRLVNSISQIVP